MTTRERVFLILCMGMVVFGIVHYLSDDYAQAAANYAFVAMLIALDLWVESRGKS